MQQNKQQRRVVHLRQHLISGANDPHRADKSTSEAARLPWSRFPRVAASSPPDFRSVKYQVRDGIAIITRSRPKVLNAVNFQVHADMIAAFEEAERDDSVLCAVLTGEGRFFCSGADVAGNKETYDIEDPPRVKEIKAVLSVQDTYDSNTWSDVNMVSGPTAATHQIDAIF